MAPIARNATEKRERQRKLYEEQMGAEALHRQTVEKERKGPFREPDACTCGWQGPRALTFGTHHSITCPRFPHAS